MLQLFHSSLQISCALSYYFLCLVIRNNSICAFRKIHCVHLQNHKSVGDSNEVTEKNPEELKVSQ